MWSNKTREALISNGYDERRRTRHQCARRKLAARSFNKKQAAVVITEVNKAGVTLRDSDESELV